MRETFEKMAEDIRAASAGRQIVYLPNPGNYGDGLIRYATKQFLSDFGLDHIELNAGYTRIKYQLAPYLLKGKNFFLYGGGGAWSEHYGFGRDTCAFIASLTPHLAVLPTTYALPALPKRGLMYRRDEAQSAEINPASRFCHDMAFYMACRDENLADFMPAPEKPVGIFLRTDRESRFGEGTAPAGNLDLSDLGDHMSNGDAFIRAIARCETVYTDRLHVCIGAILAGRQVKLLTGNYFKIRAIYETSIRPFFADRVELLDDSFSIRDIPLGE